MKAFVKQYRQSPRKVRLVADQVRGKSVTRATIMLKMMRKRAAGVVLKAVSSAAANAIENDKKEAKNLFIKEIRVDEGITLKRYMPRAMGRASRINKRASHILVTLGEKAVKGEAVEVKEEKKAEKKPRAAKKAKATK